MTPWETLRPRDFAHRAPDFRPVLAAVVVATVALVLSLAIAGLPADLMMLIGP